MNKLNAFIVIVHDLGGRSAYGHGGHLERSWDSTKPSSASPRSSTAAQEKTDERYLREWLAPQAAGGYVTSDEKNDKFSLR